MHTHERHNVSLIITGIVICLFVMFIVLAAFIQPNPRTDGITNEDMKAIANNMAQMIWWLTVALICLPIMLLLIIIAGYLFITGNRAAPTTKPSTSIAPAPTSSKTGMFGPKPAPAKTLDASSPGEVLDLRYARGDITRDQYMSMKADIKTPRL